MSVKLVVAEEAEQRTRECFYSSISARYANELSKHRTQKKHLKKSTLTPMFHSNCADILTSKRAEVVAVIYSVTGCLFCFVKPQVNHLNLPQERFKSSKRPKEESLLLLNIQITHTENRKRQQKQQHICFIFLIFHNPIQQIFQNKSIVLKMKRFCAQKC